MHREHTLGMALRLLHESTALRMVLLHSLQSELFLQSLFTVEVVIVIFCQCWQLLDLSITLLVLVLFCRCLCSGKARDLLDLVDDEIGSNFLNFDLTVMLIMVWTI